MSQMPRVSVLTPASNAAMTLNETVDSVVNQTFDDWELLVFDDGSTDNTAALAKQRCDADRRIRLIKGRAGGVAAARNEAAQHARAPWLLFLDADDLIRQDHLAISFAAATAAGNSPDLIYASGARLAPDGRIGPVEAPPKSDHFRFLSRYNVFFTHACLIRRHVFEQFGGFDNSLRTCEDWDLWQRLARAGVVMRGVDECLAFYRMRPNSLSHDTDCVFTDARQVILRAHGPDPRVCSPAPPHSHGLDPSGSGEALIAIAMWCAALLIGSGRSPVTFLQSIELGQVADVDINGPVSMMQGGVPCGALELQEDWPELWKLYKPKIHEAFTTIERRCVIRDFATRCLGELERRTVEMSESTNTRSLAAAVPSVGTVGFGDFLRERPISTEWGLDRGRPIDRLYIEDFLEHHRNDVRGHVLEVGDNQYTIRFGGERVTRSDVLHVDQGAPNATLFGDLATADHIESDLFDCIILTQTLQYVADLPAAVDTLYRILKSGGVLLMTVPGIGQIDHDRWGRMRHWTFTPAGVARLLAQRFVSDMVAVETRGNVLTAISFLHGLAQEDVPHLRDQADDPHYPVIIQARAVKPQEGAGERRASPMASRWMARAEAFIDRMRGPPISSVMVVVAHPDDELIGAGGHLAFWPNLSVVHVTDGAPRDPQHAHRAGYLNPGNYAAARRREAERALSLIGIPTNRVIGLDFRDQAASFRLADIARALLRLFDDQRPNIVVTHAYEGGHPDHDATCFAVQSACRLAERVGVPVPSLVEMSSYFGLDGIRVASTFLAPIPRAATIVLDEPSRELKSRMLDCHISQADILKLFPIGIESFRCAPNYDFRAAPHAGKLFYEYHDLGLDGARWRELATIALNELRLR